MNDAAKKRSDLFSNNWLITLTATLIGVFLALYLNQWSASKDLRHQKEIATKNILLEIESNSKSLMKASNKHIELLETLRFIQNHVNDEDDLVATTEEMGAFRQKHPQLISITDSTRISGERYQYKGEINLDLNLTHLDLTTLAWNTLKNSGYSSSYAFECLMYLESLDKITLEIIDKNKEVVDYLTGAKDGGENNEYFIDHLELLIDYEQSLSNIYKKSKEEMKNCDQ